MPLTQDVQLEEEAIRLKALVEADLVALARESAVNAMRNKSTVISEDMILKRHFIM